MRSEKSSKLDIRATPRCQCIVSVLCLGLAVGVVHGNERYSFSGYLNGGTTIERDLYTIVVPQPRGVLKAFQWRHFVDQRSPQNVIVNLGAGKNYSWAATVRIKGRLDAGETVAERAAQLYPKEVYSAFTSGQHADQCVIKDYLDIDQTGYERFYDYVMLCSAPAEREVFELIFSEMNLAGKNPTPGFVAAAGEFFESFAFR